MTLTPVRETSGGGEGIVWGILCDVLSLIAIVGLRQCTIVV